MTTSTSSASATGLPDRRHFLSTLAAAPVAAVASSLPLLAVQAGSGDAHLFDLGRRWEHFRSLAAEADRQLSATSAAYDRVCPDVTPDALFVRSDDDLALRTWPEKEKGEPTGRHRYGPVDIETAEAALAALPANKLPGGNDPMAREKLARLREIVESYRSDRETRRAAWLAHGMEKAERAAEAAHDRYKAAALEIAHCPATTLPGALLKVRVAVHCFGDTLDEAEAQIDGVMEEMTTGEGVALSILKDLARMAEAGRLGGGHA